MSIMPFQVALWIELLAAGLGGLQGALFAAGERHRRIDVLGVIVIGLAVSLGGSLLAIADWLIALLAAVVMGLFGAIGASKALSMGVGETGALVVGVIGAIGGGVLRDVIMSRPISFLHVGTLYAVAAGAGAGSLILLAELGTPIPIAGIVCVVVTTSVRLTAVRFGWTFPEQRAVRPREGSSEP